MKYPLKNQAAPGETVPSRTTRCLLHHARPWYLPPWSCTSFATIDIYLLRRIYVPSIVLDVYRISIFGHICIVAPALKTLFLKKLPAIKAHFFPRTWCLEDVRSYLYANGRDGEYSETVYLLSKTVHSFTYETQVKRRTKEGGEVQKRFFGICGRRSFWCLRTTHVACPQSLFGIFAFLVELNFGIFVLCFCLVLTVGGERCPLFGAFARFFCMSWYALSTVS